VQGENNRKRVCGAWIPLMPGRLTSNRMTSGWKERAISMPLFLTNKVREIFNSILVQDRFQTPALGQEDVDR